MTTQLCRGSRSTLLRYGLPLLLGLPLVIGSVEYLFPQPAAAQEQMMRTLTVTGTGDIEIPTSLTLVQLGVEVQERTAEATQEAIAERSSSLVEFLRSQNVSELQTTGINLYARYNYNDGNNTLIGYTGSNTVSFQVPTDRAGEILDQAVSAGATQINGVSFVATDEAIAAAQADALQAATQEAQQQADVVLASLGLSRQEIVSIQINGATPPPMMPMYEAAMLSDRAASSPVIGGDQTVSASVTLQIRY
ncbi:MAG: SIMPL domain-containing protein [Elainellaceae cyanobacterium]